MAMGWPVVVSWWCQCVGHRHPRPVAIGPRTLETLGNHEALRQVCRESDGKPSFAGNRLVRAHVRDPPGQCKGAMGEPVFARGGVYACKSPANFSNPRGDETPPRTPKSPQRPSQRPSQRPLPGRDLDLIPVLESEGLTYSLSVCPIVIPYVDCMSDVQLTPMYPSCPPQVLGMLTVRCALIEEEEGVESPSLRG